MLKKDNLEETIASFKLCFFDKFSLQVGKLINATNHIVFVGKEKQKRQTNQKIIQMSAGQDKFHP